ncbi:MAG: phage holin family protein [Bacteroidia bacterium]
MKLFTQILLTTFSIIIVTYLLPGVHILDAWHALLLAVVLTGLNMIVRPVLILLTLPVTVITLGLFLFVINAINILIADYLMDSFIVDGFWWALLFSILLTITTSIIENVLGIKKDAEQRKKY